MNIWLLVWSYLRARPLNTGLNMLILGLGIAVVTILIILNYQLRENIGTNARGIDMVVGAKGSPMQLILCNIFHVDFPTGNIGLVEAERIARHRLVKKAIPMALGDSYRDFRIVGTTQEYPGLYGAVIAQGKWWKEPMEVTLGASVADALDIKPGDHFASSHGLTQSGPAHDDHHFVVAGIAERTGTVIDNLILTSVESVWKVHEGHGAEQDTVIAAIDLEASRAPASALIPSLPAGDSTKQITSLLIQYRSAMGAIQLPRWVNGQSSLQAASPAFETARLFSILGVGVNILRAFAYILIFVSALGIFIALYNSLKERRYDLAIMRSMGASRFRIFLSVLLEGLVLTFFGACLGLLLAHGVLYLSGTFLDEAGNIGVSALQFYPEEGIILAVSLLLGILCALLPALQAYRTDISRVLSNS